MENELDNLYDEADRRPAPKPRKHPELWQYYLTWRELVEQRKRHQLRRIAIERGKSNLDGEVEDRLLELLDLDPKIEAVKDLMIESALDLGPVWGWVTSFKGLGSGSLAAQLLAQIDDIGKFDTVSALWRFAGYAVIDGRAEHNARGEKSHFNSRLKSTCWLVGQMFLRQQNEEYIDIYYEEKRRQRELHPEKVKTASGKWQYNDGHLHNMALRKMVKIFLQHLWVVWRTSEGLPVSEPWVIAIGGHANYISPPNWPATGEVEPALPVRAALEVTPR